MREAFKKALPVDDRRQDKELERKIPEALSNAVEYDRLAKWRIFLTGYPFKTSIYKKFSTDFSLKFLKYKRVFILLLKYVSVLFSILRKREIIDHKS